MSLGPANFECPDVKTDWVSSAMLDLQNKRRGNAVAILSIFDAWMMRPLETRKGAGTTNTGANGQSLVRYGSEADTSMYAGRKYLQTLGHRSESSDSPYLWAAE